MGPTKAIIKGDAIYNAQTGKLIMDGFSTAQAFNLYAGHHYIALPQVDNAGRAWDLNGQPVYCFRGSRYETLEDDEVRVVRCPDCGGMGVRMTEVTVERDCIRCTQCNHEFDARLEMMES
jgi:DNA-directed RNA polymerase subunit RPC12/RpoP